MCDWLINLSSFSSLMITLIAYSRHSSYHVLNMLLAPNYYNFILHWQTVNQQFLREAFNMVPLIRHIAFKLPMHLTWYISLLKIFKGHFIVQLMITWITREPFPLSVESPSEIKMKNWTDWPGYCSQALNRSMVVILLTESYALIFLLGGRCSFQFFSTCMSTR
jgi:hypothetical protein